MTLPLAPSISSPSDSPVLTSRGLSATPADTADSSNAGSNDFSSYLNDAGSQSAATSTTADNGDVEPRATVPAAPPIMAATRVKMLMANVSQPMPPKGPVTSDPFLPVKANAIPVPQAAGTTSGLLSFLQNALGRSNTAPTITAASVPDLAQKPASSEFASVPMSPVRAEPIKADTTAPPLHMLQAALAAQMSAQSDQNTVLQRTAFKDAPVSKDQPEKSKDTTTNDLQAMAANPGDASAMAAALQQNPFQIALQPFLSPVGTGHASSASSIGTRRTGSSTLASGAVAVTMSSSSSKLPLDLNATPVASSDPSASGATNSGRRVPHLAQKASDPTVASAQTSDAVASNDGFSSSAQAFVGKSDDALGASADSLTLTDVSSQTHLAVNTGPSLANVNQGSGQFVSADPSVDPTGAIMQPQATMPAQILAFNLSQALADPVKIQLRLRGEKLAIDVQATSAKAARDVDQDGLKASLEAAGYAVDAINVRVVAPQQTADASNMPNPSQNFGGQPSSGNGAAAQSFSQNGSSDQRAPAQASPTLQNDGTSNAGTRMPAQSSGLIV